MQTQNRRNALFHACIPATTRSIRGEAGALGFPDQENISPEDGALKNTDEAAPGRALEKHAAPAKVLTAIIEKPQILLETPYSVLTKNGPRLRYRLEYD